METDPKPRLTWCLNTLDTCLVVYRVTQKHRQLGQMLLLTAILSAGFTLLIEPAWVKFAGGVATGVLLITTLNQYNQYKKSMTELYPLGRETEVIREVIPVCRRTEGWSVSEFGQVSERCQRLPIFPIKKDEMDSSPR